MRASLLASVIANMLRWSRFDACSIQGHKLRIAAFGRRANTTCAACTNSVRRYLLPRLEILPRIVRSPVDSCFGTSPSQAPKSRPCVKPAPLPIAATTALEMIGPTPGTVRGRDRLSRLQQRLIGGRVGPEQNGHSPHVRRGLLEQPQPLAAHGWLGKFEASNVTARPCRAGDEPAAKRIADFDEHDWNCAR